MRAVLLIFIAACGFRGAEIADAMIGRDVMGLIDGAEVVGDAPIQTVDAIALPDAPIMLDGAGLSCPTSLGWMTLGGKHYFFSPTMTNWWDAETTCEAINLAGSATHLAVVTSLAEAANIAMNTGAPYAWVGHFQPLTATTPTTGWLDVAGNPAYDLDWETGEPNDKDSDETDHREQFVQIYMADQTLNDTQGIDSFNFVCECDGIAVTQATRNKFPPRPLIP